jgi:D-amino-acid dehydrogenase
MDNARWNRALSISNKMVYQMVGQVNSPASTKGSVGIVGAGIIGLSCAIHLRRQGYAVDLYDFREPGEGATFGNAGTIAISEVLPFSRPATLRHVPRMLRDQTGPLVVRRAYLLQALPWLLRFVAACRPAEVLRISGALAALMSTAVSDWRDLVRKTDGEGILIARGRFKLYRSEASLARARLDLPRQRECGVNVEEIGAELLLQMEPALRPVFVGAHFWPDVCHLASPIRMARILAAHLVETGGRIVKQQIATISLQDGRPVLACADGRQVAHDHVVIAAGAWSRRLVRDLGCDVPLDTERGYHVMMATPPVKLTRPVTVTDPGYSLVQMEDGVRLTSGVEFAGLEAGPDFRRVRSMAEHASGILRGLSGVPLSEWLGLRPSMPTSLPMIGPLRRHANIFLAFGHGHLGVTMGPTTGRLIADMLAGRAPSIDTAPFQPP